MSYRNMDYRTFVFPSALGWMGVILMENRLVQLTFGHAHSTGAWKHLDPRLRNAPRQPRGAASKSTLRLQAYARGEAEELDDMDVVMDGYTAFQRRVYQACRQIPRGRTQSYGELAAQLGSPHAARAVGNCMARNRIPLVIPCHRVVCSNGQVGPYSAPGGKNMKKRLLHLEKGQS